MAYFRTQRDLALGDVRASVLQASAAGQVQIGITVNGVNLCSTPLTIDQDERSSTTAATPRVLAMAVIPDDAEVVVSIVACGAGAKGLIVSFLGTIKALLPAP